MAILVDENSKIIVQGITGSEGSFHAQQCYDYAQNVVGGLTTFFGELEKMLAVPKSAGKS